MSSRQRQRVSAAPSQRAGSTAPQQLPTYEPPEHPLNNRACIDLQNLKNTHSLSRLKGHYNEANLCVTDAAAAINEVLQKREDKSRRLREKRAQKGDEDGDDSHDESLEEMQERVDRLTRKMEETVRHILDGQQFVADLEKNLEALPTDAGRSSQIAPNTRSQRHEEDEDEDEDDPDPTLPGTAGGSQRPAASVLFRESLTKDRERYQGLDYGARYAQNNNYIGFRSAVHDAQFPDQDQELPHHTTWFQRNQPAAGLTMREARRIAAGQGDDDDDDIQMTRANFNTKCPLTLQEFRDPVSSKKCPHSFEKSAIMDLINRSETRTGGSNRRGARDGTKVVQCPCPGCSVNLSAADLAVDPTFMRRLRRIQQARENEEEGMDEDEVEDLEARTEFRVPTTSIKKERATQRDAEVIGSSVEGDHEEE